MTTAQPIAAGEDLRSTDHILYGASAVTINNTVYFFGGYFDHSSVWNQEALWSLSSSLSNFSQVPTNPYASPALMYTQLISPDNQSLLTFGGHVPVNISASLPPEPLRYYRYDFANNAWTPLQTNNTSPHERFWHSAAMTPDRTTVYLYGGMNITGPLGDDFWQYDIQRNIWTDLSINQRMPRCGHTASMLSDGQMVILGGYDCIGNYTTNPILNKTLAAMDTALVFDTTTGAWRNQSIGGLIYPSPRIYHTAVTSQDGVAQPFQSYISAAGDTANMTAVLNTTSWEWMIPFPSSNQPFPRSFSSAAVVNGTKMIFGFGINYHTIYDGLYVLDTYTGQWLPPLSTASTQNIEDEAVGLVAGMAVLGAVLGSVALVMLCLLGKRLGMKNSPIIDQKYYTHTADYSVDVPDIRFCFDGWDPAITQVAPFIQCATDFGDSCSQYVLNMSAQAQIGLTYYGTKLFCYIFHAPTSFRLGQANDRLQINGTYLKFYYYGEAIPSNRSRVHIVLYNKFHDPNFAVYGVQDPFDIPFQWYSSAENAAFQIAEQENLRTTNAYDLDPNTVSMASYELVQREQMRLNAWNYIGFAATRATIFDVSTTASTEQSLQAADMVYTTNPQPLGSFHVFASSSQTTVYREQRAFTFVNAMGIVGGIFGLILGLQTCLFGYRPRSPWGVVHRWSVGQMRRSLLHGLRSRFPNGVHVPIVQPVHRRFSVGTISPQENKVDIKRSYTDPRQQRSKDDLKTIVVLNDDHQQPQPQPQQRDEENNDERMARLEERLHVFELLFQAYYINDEVFRSLDHALHSDLGSVRERRPRHNSLRPRFSFLHHRSNDTV
ncbi:Leucine-zipper-like transcriptional regulator 1 [Apophysomyces sp. BC1021]|nr:Leucine-zipper-like transcriptional regulator 1 [Apophysomyces sp. BC1021]